MRIRWRFRRTAPGGICGAACLRSLNRYPEAGSLALAARFAKAFGVGRDQVLIGNGSDELIQILCTALARPGAEVMIPVPTFAMYRISAQNAGLKVAAVPLDAAFDLDLAGHAGADRGAPPRADLSRLAQQPDGQLLQPRSGSRRSSGSRPGIVVVDEAYFHFSGQTFLPLLGPV